MSYSLSVVVTVYNLEKYLTKCLESIIAQEYPVKEIIIVDDGSTDNSCLIYHKYKKENINIIIIKTERVGTAAARMEGTKRATGDYIAYIDGDDWIESTMYSEYMKQVNMYSPDVVIGEIIKDYNDKSIKIVNRIKSGIYNEDKHTYLIKNMLDCGSFSKTGIHASLCSKVFKREKIEPYISKVDKRIVFGEDAAVLYSFLIDCESAVVIDYGGYHWVMHDNSKTHSHDILYLEELNYLDNYMRQILPEEQLLPFMVNQIQNALHREFNFCSKYEIRDKVGQQKQITYLFPFELIEKKDRVLIYGNGIVGNSFCLQLKNGYCHVVGIVDKNNFLNDFYNVISPEQVVDTEFDKLIIAIDKAELATEIKKILIDEGVNEDKIIWKNYRISQSK